MTLLASQFTTKFGKQSHIRDLATRILSVTDIDPRGMHFKIEPTVPYPTACGNVVEIPSGLNIYQFAESLIHEVKHLDLNRHARSLGMTCDEIEQEVRSFTASHVWRVRDLLTVTERIEWDRYQAEIDALRALPRSRQR